MFTAILWDYDGTLANTPVKNIAVTRAVLGRLDPALLDPLPEALSSLAAYQAANYRWRNWRELYQHALRVPADRLDEAGALWGPCQLADRTLPPLFGGLLEVLPRLAALAPMGICSQNDSGNIRAALAAHGAADCFAAVVGHADVDFARQKPDPAAFLADIRRYTKELVQAVKDSTESFVHDNVSQTPCPACGKLMLAVTGKKGRMLVCPDRECGHRQNVSMETNSRCPVCHKKLELFGDGDKQSYVCRCGFREKAEKFRERTGAGAGMSKRAVQQYLAKHKNRRFCHVKNCYFR